MLQRPTSMVLDKLLPLAGRLLGGASSARSAAPGALTALSSRLPDLVPLPEFASRIEPLPEVSSSINNEIYADPQLSGSWHAEDTSSDFATLHLLNAARVPYFDRVWRQQLRLSPRREGAFLEVGCGGGVATTALATLGYHISGVDRSLPALDAAREHAKKLGVHDRALFAHGSAYDLGAFADGSFDGVLLADVLEHLHDLPKAVAEVHRVLRPGGVFAFDTINRTYRSYLAAIVLAEDVAGVLPPNTHDWRLFIKPHELSFLLQAHGFLVDTGQFRGMAPRLRPDPIALARSLASGKLPPAPLGPFVEIVSLEVNYLGWAQKAGGPGEEDAPLGRQHRKFRASSSSV